MIVKGDFLGEFEQMVLWSLLRLRDNAYGMTIRQEIEHRTGRSVSIGAAYATLDRLEEKGYVSSSVGDSTPERGGKAKRYFKITSEGQEALQRSRQALESLWHGVAPVYQGASS